MTVMVRETPNGLRLGPQSPRGAHSAPFIRAEREYGNDNLARARLGPVFVRLPVLGVEHGG
eukprot:8962237-Alexandrium_andersonii.AAC.1